jgi:uncharacterized protein
MVRRLRILAVADEVDPRLYRPSLHERQPAPELLLGCGDLPAYYLDYLVSQMDAPMFAVHGNHDDLPGSEGAAGYATCGATWIGGRSVLVGGALLAGLDGSVRYSAGGYQSTQAEMSRAARMLAPWLWLNRVRYGRYLDVLVTHAPGEGIHDRADPAHQGFKAFRWLLQTFKPAYHLHGHVHVQDPRVQTRTRFVETEVVNVYPFKDLVLELPSLRALRPPGPPLRS